MGKFIDINSLKIDKTVNLQNKSTNVRKNDIAIIGISCKIASADNIHEFWEILANDKECLRDVDLQRKDDIYAYLESKCLKNKSDVIKFNKFNCMNDIDKFDYDYFKITPSEAELMDPKQRLFLQSSLNALEDAGYGEKNLAGKNIGIFVGASIGKKSYLDMFDDVSEELLGKVMTGNLPSVIASRLSYVLNLKGPSFVVDTACSSALVAVHLAIESLRMHDCEMAIVGGADYCFLPQSEYDYNIGISSSDLKTKTFDDSSDGTNSGEACVAIVIKQLNKAIQDNDHIYAVIKGSAINQDGSSVGITAPNMESQENVILKAWREAGIDPESISYIETHGTGTKLGDPIEVNAITNAFRKFTNKKQFCAIGSVKTNVGHTNAVSGMVSLVKAVLCMQHRQIPASLNFKIPNRNIDFINSPLYVNTSLSKWDADILRCGVSSFGLSGTNAHVVLEEYNSKEKNTQDRLEDKYVILSVSANSVNSLYRLINDYIDYLRENETINISDFTYTANTSRKSCKKRVCFVAKSRDELIEMLIKASVELKQNNMIMKSQECKSDITKSKEIINKFISTGRNDKELLNNLCKIYLDGYEIDWNSFYHGKSYYKLSIPVYPFELQRCWFNLQKNNKFEDKFSNICNKLLSDKNLPENVREQLNSFIDVYENYLSKQTVQNLNIANIKIIGRANNKYSETEKFLALKWNETFGYNQINITENFFDLGIDSLQVVTFFSKIRKRYTINVTDIYNNPSIYELANFIENSTMNLAESFREFKNMYIRRMELIERFANHEFFNDEFKEYFHKNKNDINLDLSICKTYENILLTGVTGYLGIYLLKELLLKTQCKVYLLIREKNSQTSEERLVSKLNHFFGDEFYNKYNNRIQVISSNIIEEKFGIEESLYEKLANSVDCIFHAAAYTSHFGIYDDFYKANVVSAENIIAFAEHGRIKDINYISTFGVAECNYTNKCNKFFSEYDQIFSEKNDYISNYYTKTKIIAEALMNKARQNGVNVNIFRMDNISFEYKNGTMQENIENNAFCLLIRAYMKLGVIPDITLLFDCSFVDYISKAVILLFNRKSLLNQNFHISNPNVVNLTELLVDKDVIGCGTKISLDEFIKYAIENYDVENNAEYIQDIMVHLLRGGNFKDSGDYLLHIESTKTNDILKRLDFKWEVVTADVFNRFVNYCKRIKFL